MEVAVAISIDDVSWVVSTPRSPVPPLRLNPSLLARFESAGASDLHTLSSSFNLGDAMGALPINNKIKHHQQLQGIPAPELAARGVCAISVGGKKTLHKPTVASFSMGDGTQSAAVS